MEEKEEIPKTYAMWTTYYSRPSYEASDIQNNSDYSLKLQAFSVEYEHHYVLFKRLCFGLLGGANYVSGLNLATFRLGGVIRFFFGKNHTKGYSYLYSSMGLVGTSGSDLAGGYVRLLGYGHKVVELWDIPFFINGCLELNATPLRGLTSFDKTPNTLNLNSFMIGISIKI